MNRGVPEIKTEACLYFENTLLLHLFPEHSADYQIVLNAIREIAGPDDAYDFLERAYFETIAHRLFGRMSRSKLRRLLTEMLAGGVVDRDRYTNGTFDYLPRYPHLLGML